MWRGITLSEVTDITKNDTPAKYLFCILSTENYRISFSINEMLFVNEVSLPKGTFFSAMRL